MGKCSEQAYKILHYTLYPFISSLTSRLYFIIILNQHKNPIKYNSSSNICPQA